MGTRSAVKKLQAARDQIARIAARWQADGRDTSPLANPLVTIQEAIAELELKEAEARRTADKLLLPAVPQGSPQTRGPIDG
jgi:hypothetical protein